MKTTVQGRQAEVAVAEWLKSRGFEILGQNWRTPRCEIDIIARKNNVVYFVEVKYRASAVQGDGFDYILPRKLRQLNLAARIWIAHHKWSGDWRLLVAAVSGTSCQDVKIIELS